MPDLILPNGAKHRVRPMAPRLPPAPGPDAPRALVWWERNVHFIILGITLALFLCGVLLALILVREEPRPWRTFESGDVQQGFSDQRPGKWIAVGLGVEHFAP